MLGNQQLLLGWHLALKGVTSAVDYLGVAANYLTFAAPVFSGRGRWAGLTPAQVAQRVSNSSFATLQLIYSFTQVLDASKALTDLAGYALRVQQLLAALEAAQTAPTPTSEVAEAALAVDVDAAEGGGGDPDLDRVRGFTTPATGANETVDGTLRGRRGAPWMRKPPSLVEFRGEPVEYSVHAAPPALRPELFRLFPQLAGDAVPFERLLLVPTFQFYTQVRLRLPEASRPSTHTGDDVVVAVPRRDHLPRRATSAQGERTLTDLGCPHARTRRARAPRIRMWRWTGCWSGSWSWRSACGAPSRRRAAGGATPWTPRRRRRCSGPAAAATARSAARPSSSATARWRTPGRARW